MTDREWQRGIERRSCCYSFINNQSSSSDAIAVNNLITYRSTGDGLISSWKVRLLVCVFKVRVGKNSRFKSEESAFRLLEQI